MYFKDFFFLITAVPPPELRPMRGQAEHLKESRAPPVSPGP